MRAAPRRTRRTLDRFGYYSAKTHALNVRGGCAAAVVGSGTVRTGAELDAPETPEDAFHREDGGSAVPGRSWVVSASSPDPRRPKDHCHCDV